LCELISSLSPQTGEYPSTGQERGLSYDQLQHWRHLARMADMATLRRYVISLTAIDSRDLPIHNDRSAPEVRETLVKQYIDTALSLETAVRNCVIHQRTVRLAVICAVHP
jgi:hypothetical protein